MELKNMFKKKVKPCISDETVKQHQDLNKQLDDAHSAMQEILRRASLKLAR